MANILDYLKWRGDLSFNDSPFNEVDNLILSQMIYTDFDEVIGSEETLTVKQASDRYFTNHTIEQAQESKSFIHLAPIVLLEMSQTKRFKDLKMHHFVHELDKEKMIQFAAIQIDITKTETYIAFRGTDDTLIGWQEDFDMTFIVVPSQIAALNYIKKNMSLFRKYYLGGHSKGGNLVAYAAMKIEPKYLKRIIKIYDNDGPGLSDNMFEEEEYQRVLPKFVKFVPEFDVFGVIFDPSDDHIVVESTGFAANQHDAMTWCVQGNKFVYKEEINNDSKLFRQAVQEFIDSTNSQQKQLFTRQLFQAFDKAGVAQITDIYKGGIPKIVAILKALLEIDKSAYEVASKLLSCFVGSYTQDIKRKFKLTNSKQ